MVMVESLSNGSSRGEEEERGGHGQKIKIKRQNGWRQSQKDASVTLGFFFWEQTINTLKLLDVVSLGPVNVNG